jgi:hypothetical protein
MKLVPTPITWGGESRRYTIPELATDDAERNGFVDVRVDLRALGWGRTWNQLRLAVGELDDAAAPSYHLLDVALCAEC